jgi:hypothetical protein
MLFQEDPSTIISPCGLYRYRLERVWDDSLPLVVFVCLNPSTADAQTDDRTVRRCIGFAKNWGFGRLRVVNLFALRSKDWKVLYRHPDPTGPNNDQAIIDAVTGERTVCAWGARRFAAKRARRVLRLVVNNALTVDCLKLTQSGCPQHPLFVKANAVLTPYPSSKQVD